MTKFHQSWSARQRELAEVCAGWLIGMAALALIFYCLGATPASALPCLGKLERGATSYRIVAGVKCWYVGDRVPGKDEFTPRKRKEVVRRAPAQPDRATPAAAIAALTKPLQAEDTWLAAERPGYIFEALCGDACGALEGKDANVPTAAERVGDAFRHLTVTPERVSWLYVRREEIVP